ncbi:MAG TPA: cytochrome c3 family protein [Myxococcota bacterium]|nr:cytochrome c3 family protein [Myxococcota bacterium]
MPQLFKRRHNALAKLSLIALVLLPTVIFVVLSYYKWSPFETEVGVALSQPVPFSHKHHVFELGIDCRFCHSLVEDFSGAGMPPSKTCMTCHSQIWHGAPMLKPVRDSFKAHEPIGWNQVYRIPKYVYFDHSIHVQKGIGCSSCHGEIDRMPLTEKDRTFYMRDCLSCHREPEKFLRPRDKIFNAEYKIPGNQLIIGKELLHNYNIHKEHLMDCYTCHR